MRLVRDTLLVALQWALVVLGLYNLVVSLHLYRIDVQLMASLPSPQLGVDTFRPPVFQRMVQGVTTGLIAMGLGGVLFYLRSRYLSRRPQ